MASWRSRSASAKAALTAVISGSAALVSRCHPPAAPGGWQRLTSAADPEITAVNAAFALALLERHDAIDDGHPLYDLADAAAADAPEVSVSTFRRRFRSLGADPGASEYRKTLVDLTREYVLENRQAAD